jgi:hypothetical protein
MIYLDKKMPVTAGGWVVSPGISGHLPLNITAGHCATEIVLKDK